MWWTMLMAMMLPSAAPAILTFAAVNRKLSGQGSAGEFAAGYALVWTAFSLAATALHLIFEPIGIKFNGLHTKPSLNIIPGLTSEEGRTPCEEENRDTALMALMTVYVAADRPRPGVSRRRS
jgi:hypothetical protein